MRGRRARSAFTAGGIFGITFLAPLIVWLANLGLVPWLTLTAVQALVFALAAMPLPRLIALPGWPLYTAAWWVVLEAVRGRAPLGGFPWGRLAFGQADAPYAGWAAVGGGPALSFAVAFLGSLLVYGLTAWRGGRRQVSAAICLGVVALITTPLALPARRTSGPSAVVAVVQGNVKRERTLEEQARLRNVAQNHARETKALAAAVRRGEVPRPDVVLWPENSLDGDPGRNPELGSLVADAVRELDSPSPSAPYWKPPAAGRTTPASCGCPARARPPGTPSASSYPSASTYRRVRCSAASARSSSSRATSCPVLPRPRWRRGRCCLVT